MMQKYFQKFFHTLQIFDTSLGIDIRSGRINFVRVQKRFKGFKRLHSDTLNPGIDSFNDDIIAAIGNFIQEKKLQSKYMVIRYPADKLLLKRITLPKMPQGELPLFLSQNHELFLPHNLDMDKFKLYTEIVDLDRDEMTVLVFVFRKSDLEFFEKLMNEHAMVSVIPAGLEYKNLLKVHKPEFSGYIVDLAGSKSISGKYREGSLQRLSYTGNSSSVGDFIKNDSAESHPNKNGQIVFNASKNDLSQIPEHLLKEHEFDFNDKLPVNGNLLSAGSLSYRPFIGNFPGQDIFGQKNRQGGEQFFFKHLTMKLILAGGLLIIFLYFISQGIFYLLNNRYERQIEHLTYLQPLLQKEADFERRYQSFLTTRNYYSEVTRQRTYFSYYLFRIAEIIPDNIWIREFNIGNITANERSVVISGFALEETAVSSFLGKLEELPFTHDILLDELTVHPRADIYRKWKLRYPKLIEFKVSFNV